MKNEGKLCSTQLVCSIALVGFQTLNPDIRVTSLSLLMIVSQPTCRKLRMSSDPFMLAGNKVQITKLLLHTTADADEVRKHVVHTGQHLRQKKCTKILRKKKCMP